MEILISLCLGITLSAASGLRVFIPPLIMCMAALFGDLPLAPNLQWIGSYPALIVLSTAVVVEVLAYYIPGVNNLLDLIEIPTAIAVGSVLTAATLGDLNPVLQWTLAILAGGSAAGIVETTTSVTRVAATTMTGGVGNPVLSTIEAVLSVVLTLLGLAIPLLAAGIVLLVIIGLIRKTKSILLARRQRRKANRMMEGRYRNRTRYRLR
ncbi:DUF4126 domain-containing protein [Acaryochloris marina]|uniref:DUF4126 domain-containing protein n=1 Tax=Acaryochloris marina (strain MBIC 11017) TaxID=329726 RepID=B0C7Q9_ACAM1|nr:DUF4126 domain-containing protein [Acaryochloris marina]ABW26450.1 conserved hypothetical protein [Acaryochloris marina MBIC11017]BDM81264.1 hypothetical protein AM10699_41310 [Acaryochloris marina MBIC10699]